MAAEGPGGLVAEAVAGSATGEEAAAGLETEAVAVAAVVQVAEGEGTAVVVAHKPMALERRSQSRRPSKTSPYMYKGPRSGTWGMADRLPLRG